MSGRSNPALADGSLSNTENFFLKSFPGSRAAYLALGVLCLAAFIVMEIIALSEWKSGRWHLSDVGNIQYIMINTWGGNFMYSPAEEGNFFAFHFSPILFLLMPLVWLSEYPVPLVTAYQLALALTPVPLFVLARQRGLSPLIGLAVGVWFLGNHFVGSLQLSNHFEAFYVLFALATMALMRRDSAWGFWTCAMIALSVKEDASVWLLAYAAWEWAFHRRESLVSGRAIKLALLCILWGAIAAAAMLLASVGESNSAARYVDRMGGISLGVDTIQMLLILAATSGGLCLLNWRAALLLLVPVPVILGNFHVTRTLEYYYSYPFLPFLGLATVAGTARAAEVMRKHGSGVAFERLLAVLLVALGIAQFPIVTRTNELHRFPHPVTPRDEMRLQVASNVLPPNAPLALQYGLWGIVPWRYDTVFLSNSQLYDRHYVFMDMSSPFGYGPDQYQQIEDRLQHELQAGRRGEVFNRYGFIILSPATGPDTTGSKNTR